VAKIALNPKPPMPATAINIPDSSNLGFLRALLAGVVFMLISAAILISAFLAWHYPQFLAGSNIEPVTLTGNDLFIAIVNGKSKRWGYLATKSSSI